ncbi:hypothetical protein CTA1_6799 [Colletotrichum tanaceti]|uniref:Uncharacterized protein n=1 Tax=Colletotrichum tanaceti TaxID=1306861 RepID=A0A4U6XDZ1_9PEZI|nr:hypothetical protein CTA1_6799 [Colletotrichum tanaceti]
MVIDPTPCGVGPRVQPFSTAISIERRNLALPHQTSQPALGSCLERVAVNFQERRAHLHKPVSGAVTTGR